MNISSPHTFSMVGAILLVGWSVSVEGTLFTKSIDFDKCWIQNSSFYSPFNNYEKQKYFYPRDNYLNDEEVAYYVVNNDETEALAAMCQHAANTIDAKWQKMFSDHPWRQMEDNEARPFYYLPTFAGPVLDGQCGEDALQQLRLVLRTAMNMKAWKLTHGHAFITAATSPAVQELLLNVTRQIVQEHKQYDLKAIAETNPPPEDIVPYALSQVISIERFFRPTLQFCQLFRPEFTSASSDHELSSIDELKLDWADFVHARPVKYVMLEEMLPEGADDVKFTSRRAAFEALAGRLDAIAIAVPMEGQGAPALKNYSECPANWIEQLEQGEVLQCIAKERPAELSKARQTVLRNGQFAVITRGTYPHEENIYDAMHAHTIIINTIDKSIDMAIPFQCMVPWEEFSLRVGTLEFIDDPLGTMEVEENRYDATAYSKMLKLQVYFRPDVLLEPGFGQENRIVENVMLTALRRCTTEQITQKRNFTGHHTRCPFTDWAKQDLKGRTVHNVDLPPWVNL